MNNKDRKFNIGDKVIRINKEFYNNSYHSRDYKKSSELRRCERIFIGSAPVHSGNDTCYGCDNGT